jgi:tetratricopeptide (TPR) repeat protein
VAQRHAEERALLLAKRAVELDPLDARNQLVMAWSTAMAGRFEQSELHYELAAELNPNDPKTLVSAVLGLAFMARIEAALGLLARAEALTSIFLDYRWAHIATTRFLAADYEGALEAASRSQNAIIDTPGWTAAALRRLGREAEADMALAALQRAVSVAWAGPAPPSREDVLQWFLSAFPFRREEDSEELAALLVGG